MSGRMDWRKARLAGRRTLDYRHEGDVPDRAERWLKAVDRRRQQQQQRPVYRRTTTFSTTAGSSESPPW